LKYCDIFLAKEIKEKMISLKRQIKLHYTKVWYPMFFELTRRAIVPDSVRPITLIRQVNAESELNEFLPPFPLKRIEDVYTVDYLDRVIFPLIMEQLPSLFEILKKNIVDQAREDLYLRLRPQILEVCREQSFMGSLVTNAVCLQARCWQWLSRWSSMQIINSAIEYTVQKLVAITPIFQSPPLYIDETGSYSKEILKDVIIPTLLAEMEENLILYIDVLGRKEVVDRLAVKRNMDPYVMARVPLYQKIIDGSKLYAPTVKAMEFLEKEVLRRMLLPL
jgi:hypothetical protein